MHRKVEMVENSKFDVEFPLLCVMVTRELTEDNKMNIWDECTGIRVFNSLLRPGPKFDLKSGDITGDRSIILTPYIRLYNNVGYYVSLVNEDGPDDDIISYVRDKYGRYLVESAPTIFQKTCITAFIELSDKLKEQDMHKADDMYNKLNKLGITDFISLYNYWQDAVGGTVAELEQLQRELYKDDSIISLKGIADEMESIYNSGN